MKERIALTRRYLIMIIISIISLIIILYFFLNTISWEAETTKEACRQSVIARGTLNKGLIKTSEIIPLNCKTEKICLSADGKKTCADYFGKPSKENPITTKRIDLRDEKKAKEELLEIIAQSLYDCHWMLGEGKINFMPRRNFNRNYCLICSRIVADKSILGKLPTITRKELYRYLALRKNKDKRSYLEYLYGQYGIKSEKQIESLISSSKSDGSIGPISLSASIINLNNPSGYMIMAQESKKGRITAILSAGVAGTVALIGLAYFGAPVTIIFYGVVGASGLTFWSFLPGSEDDLYSPPEIAPYDPRIANLFECNEFALAP